MYEAKSGGLIKSVEAIMRGFLVHEVLAPEVEALHKARVFICSVVEDLLIRCGAMEPQVGIISDSFH